jgi:hypothetical protein
VSPSAADPARYVVTGHRYVLGHPQAHPVRGVEGPHGQDVAQREDRGRASAGSPLRRCWPAPASAGARHCSGSVRASRRSAGLDLRCPGLRSCLAAEGGTGLGSSRRRRASPSSWRNFWIFFHVVPLGAQRRGLRAFPADIGLPTRNGRARCGPPRPWHREHRPMQARGYGVVRGNNNPSFDARLPSLPVHSASADAPERGVSRFTKGEPGA